MSDCLVNVRLKGDCRACESVLDSWGMLHCLVSVGPLGEFGLHFTSPNNI